MYRQSEKNLLSSNIFPTCPYNMMNFGPLAAEIVLLVWGTPANFNGFRVLAALLHATLLVGVSQTAALNRGRHLYLAGRPSRWALAHISSCHIQWQQMTQQGWSVMPMPCLYFYIVTGCHSSSWTVMFLLHVPSQWCLCCLETLHSHALQLCSLTLLFIVCTVQFV